MFSCSIDSFFPMMLSLLKSQDFVLFSGLGGLDVLQAFVSLYHII